MKSNNFKEHLSEELLLEKTRRELIDKSKSAAIVKAYGTTRYDRRWKQHIYNELAQLNKIDFNALFKGNMLSFKLPIQGETDNYEVEVLFEGITDKLKLEIKRNKNKCEYKCVYRALINAINEQDILVSCTCPDWKYRQAYWGTKQRYNSGKPEVRAANFTNPKDTAGGGCKHVMKVLANLDWAVKLAITINNYIEYIRKNYEDKYARIIHPSIYDIPYNKAVQLNLFDTDDELANTMDKPEDKDEINAANKRSIYNPKSEEPEQEEKDGA